MAVFSTSAMLALQLGSAVLNSRSAKRAARRQRAELERRQADLRQAGADAAAGVQAAGNAAAAPLEREAQILRDTESLRNPILEQALTEAARTAAAPTVAERATTGRDPRTARFRVLSELLSARTLTAREGIRAARVQQAQQARAALLVQAGQFRSTAAGQAANIRLGTQSALSGLPFPETSPSTVPALTGGVLSTLQNLSDEEKEGLDTALRGLFGAGDTPSAADVDPKILEALQAGLGDLFSSLNPFGKSSNLVLPSA